MNSLDAVTKPINQGRKGKERRRFLRKIAGYAAAAMIALSPMHESIARAQAPPSVQESQVSFMKGSKAWEIGDGNVKYWVFAINKLKNDVPYKDITGPARLTVRYRPIVEIKKLRRNGGKVSVGIEYSLGREEGQKKTEIYEGKTEESKFRVLEDLKERKEKEEYTQLINYNNHAIGTPVNFTITIPKGEYTFSALTNGFIEIMRIDLIPETKKPIARPLLKTPAPKYKPITIAPKKVEHSELPLFVFEGNGMFLHEIGPNKNSGDMYNATAAIDILLWKGLSLNAGVMFNSSALSHEPLDASTVMRSISYGGIAGPVYKSGKNTFMLRGFIGDRVMLKRITAYSLAFDKEKDPPGVARAGSISSVSEQNHEFLGGGEAEYKYGHVFEARVRGSNDPLNFLSVSAGYAIPKSWVRNALLNHAYPSIETDILLLRSLESLEENGMIGGVKFGIFNVHARLGARLPIWDIGPYLSKSASLVPSFLIAGDMNASEEGFHYLDFGIGLGVRLKLKTIDMDFGWAISPLTETPNFFVKFAYTPKERR